MTLARLVSALCCAVTAASAWKNAGPAPVDTRLSVSIGLKHDVAAAKALEGLFWEVSNPASPKWAQYLSRDEVDALVRPAPDAVSTVTAWLEAGGATEVAVAPGGDWIHAVATVAQASSLFDVKYATFEHPRLGSAVRSLSAANLPAHIAALVDVVTPTTRFPAPLLPIKAAPAARSGLLGTNPTSIRTAYEMGTVQATHSGENNTQQAAGFLGQYVDPGSDLTSFFEEYYPAGKGRRPKIVGPNNAGNAGDEASLDVQYIMSIGANISTTYWYTSGSRPYQNEPFVAWLTALTALPDYELPNTVSVSYGDNEWQIEASYAAQMDVMFQKLALRGTSIMFASGDGGVAGGQSGACRPGEVFVPTFPSGSPYVTSVGATNTLNDAAASFSSGGFSNMYAAQPYQAAHIANYLQNTTGVPAAKHFNQTGRGFPDVSTIGESFWIFCQGLDEPVDGTSCAAPTFTGVVSLLNDARRGAGKAPLGYLNQVIYAHPEVFTDIRKGSNPGCGTLGFPASTGWDPVTGMGSPNYPALLKLALSLP